MYNRFAKFKIKNAILLSVTLLLLLILIQGIFSIFNIDTSRKQSTNTTSLIIQSDVQNMMDLFLRINSLTNIMETDTDFIYASANNTSNDLISDSAQFNALNKRFKTIVENSISSNSFYNSFFFLYENLPITYISPEQNIPMNFHTNTATTKIYSINRIYDESWLSQLNESSEDIIWVNTEQNRPLLCYAKKINMNLVENNEISIYPMGVFYISYDLTNLLSQLKLAKEYPMYSIKLTYMDKIIYENTGEKITPSNSDNTYTSNIAPGFTLTTSISKTEMLLPYIKQLLASVLILVTALFFGVWMLSYINNFVVRPITNMSNQLLNNEHIELTYGKPLNPEINILYKNHNHMPKHLNKMMEENKVNYYNMLQAQINPHFTYNVLNSVSANAMVNGDFTTPTMLSYLAEMMRYSITSPDELVTFADEIQNAEKFVKIQNMRTDKKITIDYNIDKKYKNVKMPKVTLQPLIENSIFHYDQNSNNSEIHLTLNVVSKSGKTIIELSDPNHANSEILNEHLQNNNMYSKANRRGLGIYNIHQRLSLIFGNEYGLHYKNTDDGLITEIILPGIE